MFPEYMNDILQVAQCGFCDAKLNVSDIDVVGVRRPDQWEAFYSEPVFVMIMRCSKCDRCTRHLIRRPRAEANDGISKFIDLIEKECEGKKPPINIPGLGKKPSPSPAASPSSRQMPPVRPSCRSTQPHHAPTQHEIQQFLNRLRRTSFKRDSKGFTDWMKGFGPGNNAADDNLGP